MRRWLVLAAVVASLAKGAARADWQVHRHDSRSLLERAERALREQPDDEAIARRLVRLAGSAGRAPLVARFRARAEKQGSYGAYAAHANLLLALGEAQAAAAVFEHALALSPQSLPALEGRARALAAAGSQTEAIDAYDQVLRDETRPRFRRRSIEAELALLVVRTAGADRTQRSADLERIVKLRRELLAVDPDREGAALRLADALEQAGRPAEGAAVLEERLVPDRAGDRLTVALRAARLRIATGDPTEAKRAMDLMATLAHQLRPSDTERRQQAWSVALEAARHGGAMKELADELGRRGQANGPAEWDALAQARDDLGDLDGAAVAARAAAERAPRDPAVAGRLTTLLERLGRDEEATRILEELARRMPENVRFPVELVERAMRRGQREAAAATLDRAITRLSHDRAALMELAGVASRWGLEDRALAAWQRLHRLEPRNEIAIIGVGEAEFQLGRKTEARRAWAALQQDGHSPIAGLLRYAEVLLEHDFGEDAARVARRAQALDPKSTAPHRLLAQIFEREKKIDDAVTEWSVVLGMARATSGDGQASVRREARTRLLALYARQGRGRLDNQIRKLAAEAAAHPSDAETTLFLAEAQERAGDANGAAATLRALLTRLSAVSVAGAPSPDPGAQTAVDATFVLVHLLKRTGQLEEAIARLEDVARQVPGRAREAELQIAEIALARYDTGQALAHAARAVAGADGPMLARIGELQAKAGDEGAAVATLRQAVARDGGSGAAVTVVRLLERRGNPREAAEVLDFLLRSSKDGETVGDAERLAVELAEVDGSLEAMQAQLIERLAGHDDPASRRALVAALRRVLPRLYRDPAADEARARLARQSLRVLLQLLTDGEQPPDSVTVELAGMLGNRDAAPAVARLLDLPPPARTSDVRGPLLPETTASGFRGQPGAVASSEVRLAAVVALGRLGDPRGTPALERLATTADPTLRAASIWALGRVSNGRALPLLLASLQDRRSEVALAACTGLGRSGSDRARTALLSASTDVHQRIAVRRAAILALGRTWRPPDAATMFRLMDSGDDDLATAAALALAWSGDPGVLPGLLERALLPRRFGLPSADAPLAGLAAFSARAEAPDEGRLLASSRFDLEGAIVLSLRTSPAPDLLPMIRTHTAALQATLGEALAAGGDARREALVVMDGPNDRLALGALSLDGDGGAAAETFATLREVVSPLVDRIAALLDDEDEVVRATTLRLLSKLGDGRVTAARVAAALTDDSPLVTSAATFAAAVVGQHRPGSVAALVVAFTPVLSSASWRHRLAAVEALASLGPGGQTAVGRVRGDPNPLVRAAVLDVLTRHAIDLPAAESTMP